MDCSQTECQFVSVIRYVWFTLVPKLFSYIFPHFTYSSSFSVPLVKHKDLSRIVIACISVKVLPIDIVLLPFGKEIYYFY